MLRLYLMAQGHPYWDKTISLAEKCSWRAGPLLAERMRRNEFLPWERVCAACVDGAAAGFCTFTRKDDLLEEYAFTPFIGFVFVAEPHRGKRLSETMIQSILPYARELGYERIYVMSGETGLYEKYGFKKLGIYETIHGSVDQLFTKLTGEKGGIPHARNSVPDYRHPQEGLY